MRRNRSAGYLASVAVAAALAVACSGSSSSAGGDTAAGPQQSIESGPPIDFDLPRSYIPSPGFCRIYYPRRPDESDLLQAQSCANIENTVMTEGVVLYRPSDGSRNVHVCYMSRSDQGVVDGIDAVSVDRLRVVRVILPRMRRTAENTQKCTYNP
jgi:hypothetical protein